MDNLPDITQLNINKGESNDGDPAFNSVQGMLDHIGSLKADSFEDRAYGCILGAFVGDSCGSYLEFILNPATKEQMTECMKMPGGGPHDVGPGQITDDSELALCLMKGLIEPNENKKDDEERVLNMDSIAFQYAKWIKSNPFDIGKATRLAMDALNNGARAQKSQKAAATKNQKSNSNGSMMRCMPMAVWTSSLKYFGEIKQAIQADVTITHPSETVQSAIVIYQCAIHVLLNSPGDKDRAANALIRAKKLATATVFPIIDQDKENCQQWLLTAEKLPADDLNYEPVEQQGWLKHAFILSFYFLTRFGDIDQTDTAAVQSFYTKAIHDTIKLGGDTDTNACIVGGMIGALVGIQNVDKEMLKKVLTFDCSKDGKKRPVFLSAKKNAVKNIQKLIKLRPLNQLVLQMDQGDDDEDEDDLVKFGLQF